MNDNNLPWVLLIVPPEHYLLVNAFTKYANVVPYFIDPWHRSHLIHRIVGRSSYRLGINDAMLKYFQHFTNPNHTIPVTRSSIKVEPSKFDLVLVSDPIVCNIDFSPFKNAKKAYWAQDSGFPWVFKTQTVGMNLSDYDVIFAVAKEFVAKFQKYSNSKTKWLPFYFHPEIHQKMKSEKIYDITFVGNIHYDKKREAIINTLRGEFANKKFFFGSAWQHDMVDVFNKSKIVLNISRVGKLNQRDFETLGCGQLLLRDKGDDEVTELFKDGHHLALYADGNDLIQKVGDLLYDNSKREEISHHGYLEVQSKHSIYHRIQQILSDTFR